MHSADTIISLLLLLLALSAATTNAFLPKRQRRFLTTSSSTSTSAQDSSIQSLHRRDVSLHFGLQLRGGNIDNEIISDNNDAEVAIEDEAQDSNETAKRVWEEEIKRTQSFYQEHNARASAVEDVRGYGNSESSSVEQSSVEVDSDEGGDESEPLAQADEDIGDVVEVEADTEAYDNEEVEAVQELSEEVLEDIAAEEEEETIATNDASDEVLEEEKEVVKEDLQVEVAAAEEQASDSGEEVIIDAEEVITDENDDKNDVEEIAEVAAEEGEVAKEVEVIQGQNAEEEVLKENIVDVEQSTAVEESADDDRVDSVSSAEINNDDNEVAEGDVTAAESSESTPEASVAVVNDESSSLLRKAGALLQVMLLRGQIAVSKNKGVQYIAKHKSKIALALGGVLSLLVGGHFFLREEWHMIDESDSLELPSDDWIEEESYADEADEDDNDY